MRSADPILLALLSFVVLLVTFATVGAQMQAWNIPIGLVFSSLLVFGAPALVFAAMWGQSAARFTGLDRFPVRAVGLAIVLGVVNLPFANWLMGVASELMPATWVQAAKATERLLALADPTSRLLLVLAAAVAAPIGEELAFRGWLQPLAERRFPSSAAVWVVAVAFAAMHLDPVGFAARLELGLLFGVLRLGTGSLWPAIAMHATHNFVSIAAAILLVEDPVAQVDQPFPWVQASLFAAGSVFLSIAVLRALDLRRPAPAEEAPLRMNIGRALAPAFVWLVLLVGAMSLLATRGRDLPGGRLLEQLSRPSTR